MYVNAQEIPMTILQTSPRHTCEQLGNGGGQLGECLFYIDTVQMMTYLLTVPLPPAHNQQGE
ncbi:hypothetical protein SCP_0200160 [Sparassis crispa]|uniref:Uncharacterized protein n=1 Tax=Sparassis crispa TaxID=139825 RepID=A0A401G9J5_9APHY|nr:hypothetical protein SCP_0200160 [Sparassis crispa]GBE78819.1 hypothetical protein SCP_0200160 [Sparassis crispa]